MEGKYGFGSQGGRWRDVEISSTAVTEQGTKLYPRRKQSLKHE